MAVTEGTQDNLTGSVLNILGETKIVKSDRVSCISRLVIEHEPGGVCGVRVKVKPLTQRSCSSESLSIEPDVKARVRANRA